MSTIILPIKKITPFKNYSGWLTGLFENPPEWKDTYIRITFIRFITPLENTRIYLTNCDISVYPDVLKKMKKSLIELIEQPLLIFNCDFYIFKFNENSSDAEECKTLLNQSYIQLTWNYIDSLDYTWSDIHITIEKFKEFGPYDFFCNELHIISTKTPIVLENLYLECNEEQWSLNENIPNRFKLIQHNPYYITLIDNPEQEDSSYNVDNQYDNDIYFLNISKL